MDDAAAIQTAFTLVEDQFVGTLCTVDLDGYPHARLMGAGLKQEPAPPRLYCLTGRETRKIEHLRKCPRVSWLFHSPDQGTVVQLLGDASVLNTSQIPGSIWDLLCDYAQPYAEASTRDQDHFSFDVIETRIDQVELSGVDFDLFTPRVIRL